jgi:hypothetical protein
VAPVQGTAGFRWGVSGKPVQRMPDRAIIPLLPALSVGFICGIISSALLLGDGGTIMVGVVGAVFVAIAAVSSIFGVRADSSEKAIVAALRAACAAALFASVYLFILGFLRNGEPLTAMIWLVLAFAFALIITRLCVRERRDESHADADARAEG